MMSMKFEKWWWPVQCYTLSNGLNFAGLIRLGYLYYVSVWCLWKYFGEWEILQQQSQQFLITSFIREIMEAVHFIFYWHFMWWMHMHTYLSQKGRSWVVGIFFVSFHFFFFPSSIELPRLWKFDQELRMEKRNHPFRDISLMLFFFLLLRFFVLVMFWLFTIGQ